MSAHPLELSDETMRRMVDLAMERIVDHIHRLPGMPAADVEGGAALARSLAEPLPETGTPYETLLELLFDRVIPKSFNTAGPGYLAYIPGGGLFHAAVANLIASATNRYVGVFQAAPGLAQLEANVVRWLCGIVGYPPASGGVLTTGGSIANLMGIVTARRERLEEEFLDGVVYVSDQAHHSVLRAAVLAGFPRRGVRAIPTDERYRVRVDRLAAAIRDDRAAGRKPFLVVGNAGTTNSGAVDVDWTRDLNDQVRRDYISRPDFEALMSRIGMTQETTAVFYGDQNNWWACYAFWVFQLFGHTRARVMDGGRVKWVNEKRPLTGDPSPITPTTYRAPERVDGPHRAFRDEVMRHVEAKGQLVDVRSPEEFAGTRLHMPDYPNEGALRGGHIPGARSIPWARAIDPEDGTFLPAAALRRLYVEDNGLDPANDVIAYCRIGERSSHTWFALKYLLGFPKVRNYDGSWTEWGNLVNAPIER